MVARDAATDRPPSAFPPLAIGLVNGMPGEARWRTERQFRGILGAAAQGRAVALHIFALDAAASDTADGSAASPNDDVTWLDPAALDGLIVTGMPPRATSLDREPCWPRLMRLIDQALDNGIPAVWSCLAAHAAVLYLDGIERRPLPEKLSGLVPCSRTAVAHELGADLPRRWQVPHSRYNDVPEDALRACGYTILSASDTAGVDIFVKDGDAPFLFCQGHPEYDADTLLREYRRDVRAFLAGERDTYPPVPQGCFGDPAMRLLAAFRQRAIGARDPAMLTDFPFEACAAALEQSWRPVAVTLYSNWLGLVAERRERRRPAGARRAPQDRLVLDAPLR